MWHYDNIPAIRWFLVINLTTILSASVNTRQEFSTAVFLKKTEEETMLKRLICLSLPCVLLVCSTGAGAFEVNSKVDTAAVKRNQKAVYHRLAQHLTHGTHEKMTSLSLACAQGKIEDKWCDLGANDRPVVREFDRDGLQYGARWNDDPNNFLRSGQELRWLYWIQDASVHKSDINTRYPLEYRSHYGDLQFLHGMGRQRQAPSDVREHVMNWLHFAYDVSTGQIKPAATLSSLEQAYPFARNFSGTRKSAWTVQKLFDNVGDWLCETDCELGAGDEAVRTMALGAMLHTLQDSYSHSHVERSGSGVTAWLDYAQQDSQCHHTADAEPSWIGDKALGTKPAIRSGAWVVRAAMSDLRWDSGVKAYLDTVFALDRHPRAPDGGGYQRGDQYCPSVPERVEG